jgi:F-type H+-transporting ATPase subunit gamma
LEALLPRYVRTRVFNALLEAAASEHAARRRAMAAATENADELIKVLTREANQARQTEITTEIMEIVGGAEALRKQAGGQGGTPSGARQEETEAATPVG